MSSEANKLIEEISQMSEKRVTKAHVKKAIKNAGLDPNDSSFDITSPRPPYDSEVTFQNEKQFKEVQREFEKLGFTMWMKREYADGEVTAVWKGEPEDMGDWNDPGSKWHY